MAKEEILIDVLIDAAGSAQTLAEVAASTRELTKAKREQKFATEEGKKAIDLLNQQINKNNEIVKANASALEQNRLNVGNYTESIIKAADKIEQLKKQNKEYAIALKTVNKDTEEGAKTYTQINNAIQNNITQINQYQTIVNQTTSATDRATKAFQGAVPAIDGFTGGLASSIQAASGLNAGFLKLAMNPIGAVIAALGLAVVALTAYFKGSDEAQDQFAEASAVVSKVLDGLTLIVEKVGEVIFKTFSFGATIIKNFIDFIVPSAGKAMDEVILRGKLLAKLQDDLENKENENVVKRAVIEQKVSKLREDSIKQEGEVKRKTIEEAIRLEKQLSDISVDEAKRRLGIFLADTESQGKLTGEQIKQKAELTAAVIRAETERFDATRKFEKQLEQLRDEAEKARIDRLKLFNDENNKALLTTQENELAALQSGLNLKIQAEVDANNTKNALLLEQKALFNEASFAMDAEKDDADAQVLMKEVEIYKATKQKELEIEKVVQAQKTAVLIGAAGQWSNILGRQTAEGKALASIQAGVDTYAGANAQLKLPFPYNLIAVSTTIATGLVNIAKINGFANGGRIGSGFGLPISRANGDNILATVKTGEVILNESQQAALGGSRTFRSIGVPGFADGGVVGFPSSSISTGSSPFMDFNKIKELIQSQPIVVTVEDINKGLTRVAQIEDRATF